MRPGALAPALLLAGCGFWRESRPQSWTEMPQATLRLTRGEEEREVRLVKLLEYPRVLAVEATGDGPWLEIIDLSDYRVEILDVPRGVAVTSWRMIEIALGVAAALGVVALVGLSQIKG